jgi:class 3 adenylate cyclase
MPVGFVDAQVQRERKRSYRQLRATATPVTDLPSGRVTLMMTDIEESSGLLQALGEAYKEVVSGVRAVVGDAVTMSHGWPVDARADECFGVFEGAGDAVEAATSVQRTLTARSWPSGSDVRVRIGLHTGRAKLTDVGYIGVAVHTVARICSAGHGGQILASAATVAAAGSKRQGLGFRELGRHRLRGLRNAETLFQVEARDLPSEFPPVRTAGAASEAAD